MSMLQAMGKIGEKIDIFQVFKTYHRDIVMKTSVTKD